MTTSNQTEVLNQHFLVDSEIPRQMVLHADVDSYETALEIGPGKGSITREIALFAGRVVAIEKDARMRQYLEDVQREHPNVSVIYGDAITARFPKHDKMVGNIPFNITEPLMMKLFNGKPAPSFLLVGENFANSACRRKDTRLGLLTNAYFSPEHLMDVGSESFDPEPSTNAVLVGLYPREKMSMKKDFPLFTLRCVWDQNKRPLQDAFRAALSQYTEEQDAGIDRYVQETRAENPYMDKRVDALTSYEFTRFFEYLSSAKPKRIWGGSHKPRGGGRSWQSRYGDAMF
ncbi:MAG: hypothetical protein HY364_00665 [Candidatus Aenigmarchaeota archaeon]|nr:hypothetical protein [Candidatus Aenigmarchaeota archaeon]